MQPNRPKESEIGQTQPLNAPVVLQPQTIDQATSSAKQAYPQPQASAGGHEASRSASSGAKLQIIGGVLLVCSIFGIVEIIFRTIANLLLGNPAVNTSGRAVVNITTLGSGAVGFILGIALLITGSVRKARK